MGSTLCRSATKERTRLQGLTPSPLTSASYGRKPFSRSSDWRSSSRPVASLTAALQVTLVPLSKEVVERRRACSVCAGSFRAIGSRAGR